MRHVWRTSESSSSQANKCVAHTHLCCALLGLHRALPAAGLFCSFRPQPRLTRPLFRGPQPPLQQIHTPARMYIHGVQLIYSTSAPSAANAYVCTRAPCVQPCSRRAQQTDAENINKTRQAYCSIAQSTATIPTHAQLNHPSIHPHSCTDGDNYGGDPHTRVLTPLAAQPGRLSQSAEPPVAA
jgi:hypothetical protein